MVWNNSIVEVDILIILNIRSWVRGLVWLEKKKKKIELKIFFGDIYFFGEMDKIFWYSVVLILLRMVKKNLKEKKMKNWIYV